MVHNLPARLLSQCSNHAKGFEKETQKESESTLHIRSRFKHYSSGIYSPDVAAEYVSFLELLVTFGFDGLWLETNIWLETNMLFRVLCSLCYFRTDGLDALLHPLVPRTELRSLCTTMMIPVVINGET